ncbi:MAG: hypothetical protein Tsb0020_25440 [Haliangiales bacterium]
MSYQDWCIDEMVSLSAAWVTPGHADRAALLEVPGVAACMSRIEEAHAELVASQRAAEEDRLDEIIAQLTALGARAESLWRGIRSILMGHFHLSTDAERVVALQRLDEVVFPHGLATVHFGYREVAGYGALLEARLDDAARALLASISAEHGTLLDALDEWLAIARQIGELQAEREQTPSLRVSVARQRERWIHAIDALQHLIAVAETKKRAVFDIQARLREASGAPAHADGARAERCAVDAELGGHSRACADIDDARVVAGDALRRRVRTDRGDRDIRAAQAPVSAAAQ